MVGSWKNEPVLHPVFYHQHGWCPTGDGPWIHGAELLHLYGLRNRQLLLTEVRALLLGDNDPDRVFSPCCVWTFLSCCVWTFLSCCVWTFLAHAPGTQTGEVTIRCE